MLCRMSFDGAQDNVINEGSKEHFTHKFKPKHRKEIRIYIEL